MFKIKNRPKKDCLFRSIFDRWSKKVFLLQRNCCGFSCRTRLIFFLASLSSFEWFFDFTITDIDDWSLILVLQLLLFFFLQVNLAPSLCILLVDPRDFCSRETTLLSYYLILANIAWSKNTCSIDKLKSLEISTGCCSFNRSTIGSFLIEWTLLTDNCESFATSFKLDPFIANLQDLLFTHLKFGS